MGTVGMRRRREDGEEKKALLWPFQTPSSSVVLIPDIDKYIYID
jgi:hypothetical protein